MKAFNLLIAVGLLLCSCSKNDQSERHSSLGSTLIRLNPSEGNKTKVWIGQCETTRREYSTFIQATAHDPQNSVGSHPDQFSEYPIESVSYYDAINYCGWLTQRDREKGIISDSEYYSLPSDEEWSKAIGINAETDSTPEEKGKATKGDGYVFEWGNDKWPPPPDAGNLSRKSDFTGDVLPDDPRSTPPAAKTKREVIPDALRDGKADACLVKQFKASDPLQLYDLCGNVSEITESKFSNDPTKSDLYTVRGSSYFTAKQDECRKSFRSGIKPDAKIAGIGFRIVLRSQ